MWVRGGSAAPHQEKRPLLVSKHEGEEAVAYLERRFAEVQSAPYAA